MNFIQKYFQKRTNNMIANQDYELAEQFMNSDMSFCLNEDGSMKDGKTVGKHLFQMEGIFLDLTDRTLSHPKVPFSHEDRGGKFANIVKEEFDLRPRGLIEMLDLKRPIYQKTAAYGHFGRDDIDLPWEKTDKLDVLKKYL